jgi:hypothetical protein
MLIPLDYFTVCFAIDFEDFHSKDYAAYSYLRWQISVSHVHL